MKTPGVPFATDRSRKGGLICPNRVFASVVLAITLSMAWPGLSAAQPQGAGDGAGLNAVGPPLTALSTKVVDPNWLVAWLLKPSRLRPGTIMPDSDLTPEEAQAVATYLYAAPSPAAAGARWQGGDARTGEKLFVSRGCRGCHAIDPTGASVSPRVPNLAGIGLEVRGDWLFNWIRSPRAYNPRTPMPKLTLSDDEIRHLVAYLLSRRDGADVVAAAPRFKAGTDAAAGRRVIERYECATCHELKGSPPPAPAFELAAGDGTDTALRNGRLLVAFYNCRGCHRIDGAGGAIFEHLERKTFAPPTLEGEGARVQASWLVQFLQHPTNLRPWLQMRMPDFGLSDVQVAALGRYFAALANVPATDESPGTVSEDAVARGLRRLAHYKCVQCHPTSIDRQLPEDVDPENLSINLTLAKTRLRPSWIRDFLAHPKAIVGTQTRMPNVFYTIDGIPKVENPDQDIAAIAAYLLHTTEPPEAALAKLDAERKAEQQKPQTDWSKIQY